MGSTRAEVTLNRSMCSLLAKSWVSILELPWLQVGPTTPEADDNDNDDYNDNLMTSAIRSVISIIKVTLHLIFISL